MKNLFKILMVMMMAMVIGSQCVSAQGTLTKRVSTPTVEVKGDKGSKKNTTKTTTRKNPTKQNTTKNTNTGDGGESDFQMGYELYSNEDYTNAVPYLRKAANAGHGDAMFWLSMCYSDGTGVTQDDVQAFNWMKKSADTGDRISMSMMGLYYKYGLGCERSPRKAYEWYLKSANNGYASAMKHVGDCYFEGTGVDEDMSQALRWYRKAAEAGDANGMYRLSLFYRYGVGGVDASEELANYWLGKAAENGSTELASDQEEEDAGGDSVR